MMLGHGDTDRVVDITLEGEHIEQYRSIKILGLNLDEKLNLSLHTREVCNRISKQVGILNRLYQPVQNCNCTNQL